MRYKTQSPHAKRQVQTSAATLTPFPEPHIHYPTSPEEVLRVLEQLQQEIKSADNPEIGIDTEANWDKDDPTSGQLLLLQLGWQSAQGLEALVIHRRHIIDEVQVALCALLGDSTITKVLQNMRFDRALVLQDLDIEIAPPFFDTMIAALVLDNRGKHGLGALCERHLRHTLDKSQQASFAGFTLDTPISEAQVSYGAKDAVVLLPLRNELSKSLVIRPQIRALVNMEHQFAEAMMESQPPTLNAQRVLAQLNAALDEQLQQLATQWDSGERQVNLLALIDGADSVTSVPTVNLNSLKQIQQGLEQVGVTSDSTSPDALLKVCHQHPSVTVLLQAKWLKSRITSLENAIAEGKNPMALIQINKFGHMETRGKCLPLEDILYPDGTQYWVVGVPLIEWWALGAITGIQYGLAQSYSGLIEEHLSHFDAPAAKAVIKGALMYKLGATRLALYVWEETGFAIAENELRKHINALKRAIGNQLSSWHSQKPCTPLRLPNGRTIYWESKPSYRDWAEVTIKCVVSDWLKQTVIALHQRDVKIAAIYHQQIIINASGHDTNALKRDIRNSFEVPVQGFQPMLEVVIEPLGNSA